MSDDRLTSEAAVKKIGCRYDLILAASNRARELSKGAQSKLPQTKNSRFISTALAEVEAGLIGREYITKFESSERKRKTKENK